MEERACVAYEKNSWDCEEFKSTMGTYMGGLEEFEWRIGTQMGDGSNSDLQ